MTNKPHSTHHVGRTASALAPAWPSLRQQRPLVVNLIGPSGAGKSTLTKVLPQRDRRIVSAGPLNKIIHRHHMLRNVFPLLPTFLFNYRNTRWFTRTEMIYLAGISARLNTVQLSQHDDSVILIMNGPLYQLAYLQLFGPPLTRSVAFQQWYSNWLAVWANAINLMIWLDAPDSVLLSRVDAREQNNSVKGRPLEAARLHFARQRQLHRAAADSGRFDLLHIDTSCRSVEETVAIVLSAINDDAKRDWR